MGCSLALGTKGVASSSCGHVGSQVVRAMGLAPCPTAKPCAWKLLPSIPLHPQECGCYIWWDWIARDCVHGADWVCDRCFHRARRSKVRRCVLALNPQLCCPLG